MGLETQFDNINDLNPNWPVDDDPVSEGAAQLRGIKEALQGNVQGNALFTQLFNGSNAVPNGPALLTSATGVVVRPPSAPGAVNPAVVLQTQAGVNVAELLRVLGSVRVDAMVPGDTVGLTATTPGGLQHAGLIFDPVAGLVVLYFENTPHLATVSQGIQVAGQPNLPIVDLVGAVGGTVLGSVYADPATTVLRSAAGEVTLQSGATPRLHTSLGGVNIRSGAGQPASVVLEYSDGSFAGQLLGDVSGVLKLVTLAGQAFQLLNFGGAFMLAIEPNAHNFYLQNVLAMQLAANGLNMINHQILGLAPGTAGTDAVNLNQLNAVNAKANVYGLASVDAAGNLGAVNGVIAASVRNSTGVYTLTLTQAMNIAVITPIGSDARSASCISGLGTTSIVVHMWQTGGGSGNLVDCAFSIMVG